MHRTFAVQFNIKIFHKHKPSSGYISMEKTITHIAAVSIPAFSHQASIVEFSKRLVHLHQNLHITCIFPTLGSPPPATIAFLETLPPNIGYVFLPPVNPEDLPQGLSLYPAVQIQLAVAQSMPSFRQSLKSLMSSTHRPVALLSDPFANESLEIAKEFNLLTYIYFPPSTMTLSLFLDLPRLDEEISGEYRDQTELIKIAGCVPLHGRDLPDHLQDRFSLSYKLYLERSKRFHFADGFLVNSFLEMEQLTISVLQEQSRERGLSPVYPIGPIVQTGSDSHQNGSDSHQNGSDCLEWLDSQEPNSVLYVSFGSGGTLSQEQLNELALGLELSRQKFLWVARAPSDSASAAYLGDANKGSLQFLPSGFLERTKGRGLVVSSWAPQTQILSHNSTAGFVTHSGWNSILESVVQGVPMIVWPLFAEQRMNAVLLTESLKVALWPRVNKNGMVEKEEIALVIRNLMEGEEGIGIRSRIEDLKVSASDAHKENGSSTRTLRELVQKWKRLGGM